MSLFVPQTPGFPGFFSFILIFFLCHADSGAGAGCRATGISSVWGLPPLRMVRASPEVSPEEQEPPGDPGGDGLPTSAFFINPKGSSSLWEWVSAQNFRD